MDHNWAKNETGSLSMTALWLLTLLSLLAMGLARDVLVGLRSDAVQSNALQAAWLARAGAYAGIAVLEIPDTGDSASHYDDFSAPWADNKRLFQRVSCGTGFFEVGYSTGYPDFGIRYVYGVFDENRKICINRAPGAVLKRLPGMTTPKVEALLDWIDDNNVTRSEGAEDNAYRTEGKSYTCKNGPLDCLEELPLVKGFTDADVERLRPFVSVHGNGKVNINTAPVGVLARLGLGDKLAKTIVRWRRGPDAVVLTPDDRSFHEEGNIVQELLRSTKLKPSEQAALHRLIRTGLLGVASSHFTIQAVGVAPAGRARHRIVATVHRTNRHHVEVLSWREGKVSE